MTQRPGDPAGGMLGVPRPVPRAHALLKIGDDLAGDPAVYVADFGHFSVSFKHGLQLLLQPCPSARPG